MGAGLASRLLPSEQLPELHRLLEYAGAPHSEDEGSSEPEEKASGTARRL